MKSRYYHISEPLLLLIFTSAPVGWWVCFEKYRGLAPYPPIAYVIAAILATCSASYTLTIRLYPGLGWSKNTNAERCAKSALNFLVLILTSVAAGILPISDITVNRYLYLAIYAFSVGHLFFTHYLISMRNPIADPSNAILSELSEEQRAAIDAVRFVSIPLALAAFMTCLVWLVFRYENELPNHATVFAMLFGIFIAVASKFRSNRTKENI